MVQVQRPSRHNRVVIPVPGRIGEFVGVLKALIEAGAMRAAIDRKYRLADIADAYRYVETGQKTGTVVITIALT